MTEADSGQEQPVGRQPGFGVAASPFNAVKLDLGVIMVLGFVLLLLNGYLGGSEVFRIGVLLAYGVAGMLWLVCRARRVMKALERQRDGA